MGKKSVFAETSQVDEGAFVRLRVSLAPCWIDEALEATGTTTLRRLRLPAEQVVWLVLDRLGVEPPKWLFERCAETWGHERARRHAWRRLAVYGVDSTTPRVPDSPQHGGFRCFLWLHARAAHV
jgi:hypothetical protein